MRYWRLSTFEVDVLASVSSGCVGATGLQGKPAWPEVRPLTQDVPSGHALTDLPAEGTLPTFYRSYRYLGASWGALDGANAEPGCGCGSAKQLGRAAQEKHRTAEAPWRAEPARAHESLKEAARRVDILTTEGSPAGEAILEVAQQDCSAEIQASASAGRAVQDDRGTGFPCRCAHGVSARGSAGESPSQCSPEHSPAIGKEWKQI